MRNYETAGQMSDLTDSYRFSFPIGQVRLNSIYFSPDRAFFFLFFRRPQDHRSLIPANIFFDIRISLYELILFSLTSKHLIEIFFPI